MLWENAADFVGPSHVQNVGNEADLLTLRTSQLTH